MNDITKKMIQLYVLNRKKYLIQGKDRYITGKWGLHDDQVAKHVSKQQTIGVFSGQYFTKFICFDVDAKEESRELTYRLVQHLQEQYGIEWNNMLVSSSGGKGTHVELFFDEAIQNKQAKLFYEMVLDELELLPSQVEYRPTHTQGVKLPLSIHRKTGNECYIMDEYLNKAAAESILDIKPMDAKLFQEQLTLYWTDEQLKKETLTLEHNTATQFEAVAADTTPILNIKYQKRCIEMINNNSLLYPSSRHNSTLLLAMFYKEQGHELDDTIKYITSIIEGTYKQHRGYISSTHKHALKEVQRLTELTYKNDYTIRQRDEAIKIFKEDVVMMLKPKSIHLKKLAFTMICHAKRYADKEGQFYMSYKQITRMGNTENRTRLLQYIDALEKEGILSVIQRNECKEKSHLKHPNRYKIALSAASDKYVSLSNIHTNEFFGIIPLVLTKQQVKTIVTTDQYKKVFSKLYSKTI